MNRLRLIRTQDWSRPVQDRKKAVLSGPVRFFEVLKLWWTGLGLGPLLWGVKDRTRPDFQTLMLTGEQFELSPDSLCIAIEMNEDRKLNANLINSLRENAHKRR